LSSDAPAAGTCGVCGHTGEYVRSDAPTRENFQCGVCRASLRYRQQAGALAATCGRPGIPFKQLVDEGTLNGAQIYEPGIIGPFRQFLGGLPGYVSSYYWPDIEPGQEHDGVRCEDLRSLTFGDESFDLVISSDILEHVRGPLDAFAEIFRVLRAGGHHVFTVPLFWPLPGTSTTRVDYSGPEDRFLMPPVYHGCPTDPAGALVYTDFGMDLPEQLRQIGFDTVTHHGYRNAITFVSRKPAADG
jgi:SAM-dependent methyltransferase